MVSDANLSSLRLEQRCSLGVKSMNHLPRFKVMNELHLVSLLLDLKIASY